MICGQLEGHIKNCDATLRSGRMREGVVIIDFITQPAHCRASN